MSSPSRRPPLALFFTILIPVAVVMTGLWAFGRIDAPSAALGGAAIALALLVRDLRQFSQILKFEDYLRLLALDSKLAPFQSKESLARELGAALSFLRENWRADRERTERRVVFYQKLLDSLSEPLMLLDEEFRVQLSNQAAQTLFMGDMHGREIALVLRNPHLLDAARKALSEGVGQEAAFSYQPLGLEFQALVSPLKMKGERGAVMAISLLDITALVKTERMRADFVANASHELRTPLASIIGFIETLQGPAKGDEAAHEQFLAIMHEQASRMARLISDLLSLSKIEMNEHVRPDSPCVLPPILKRAADALSPMAKKRGATLDLDIDPALPPILGKEDELSQLFQNLIDNAIKYGKENGVVSISAHLDPAPPKGVRAPAIRISVADQGEGIRREHLSRLTERFFRVDAARSRQIGGTGLGLAIVKHIVARHRGKLDLQSTPGIGSCFSVWLEGAEGGSPEA